MHPRMGPSVHPRPLHAQGRSSTQQASTAFCAKKSTQCASTAFCAKKEQVGRLARHARKRSLVVHSCPPPPNKWLDWQHMQGRQLHAFMLTSNYHTTSATHWKGTVLMSPCITHTNGDTHAHAMLSELSSKVPSYPRHGRPPPPMLFAARRPALLPLISPSQEAAGAQSARHGQPQETGGMQQAHPLALQHQAVALPRVGLGRAPAPALLVRVAPGWGPARAAAALQLSPGP